MHARGLIRGVCRDVELFGFAPLDTWAVGTAVGTLTTWAWARPWFAVGTAVGTLTTWAWARPWFAPVAAWAPGLGHVGHVGVGTSGVTMQKSRYNEKIALRCKNRVTMKQTRHDEK